MWQASEYPASVSQDKLLTKWFRSCLGRPFIVLMHKLERVIIALNNRTMIKETTLPWLLDLILMEVGCQSQFCLSAKDLGPKPSQKYPSAHFFQNQLMTLWYCQAVEFYTEILPMPPSPLGQLYITSGSSIGEEKLGPFLLKFYGND